MTADETITSEPAIISVNGRELRDGAIRWAHRGEFVQDVWLVGVHDQDDQWTDSLSHGQDVSAIVRKGGGVLVIRRARVLRTPGAMPRVRFWLSAADTRRITALWWGPAIAATRPARRPARPRT